MAERSDDELVQAIAAQDAGALELLYARYGGATYALALRIIGNRETAEEIVQEAFLSVWRRAATFQSERGAARSWLLGITHHRAVDVVRARNARGPTVPLDDPLSIPAKDDLWAEVQQTLDRESIRRALAGLPEEQRKSIEMAYFGGMTYPEIATALDVPLGTIKSRLRLGVEKLRHLMLEASPAGQRPGLAGGGDAGASRLAGE